MDLAVIEVVKTHISIDGVIEYNRQGGKCLTWFHWISHFAWALQQKQLEFRCCRGSQAPHSLARRQILQPVVQTFSTPQPSLRVVSLHRRHWILQLTHHHLPSENKHFTG